MEKIVGEAGLEQSMKSSVLDVVNLRCIVLDFHQQLEKTFFSLSCLQAFDLMLEFKPLSTITIINSLLKYSQLKYQLQRTPFLTRQNRLTPYTSLQSICCMYDYLFNTFLTCQTVSSVRIALYSYHHYILNSYYTVGTQYVYTEFNLIPILSSIFLCKIKERMKSSEHPIIDTLLFLNFQNFNSIY